MINNLELGQTIEDLDLLIKRREFNDKLIKLCDEYIDYKCKLIKSRFIFGVTSVLYFPIMFILPEPFGVINFAVNFFSFQEIIDIGYQYKIVRNDIGKVVIKPSKINISNANKIKSNRVKENNLIKEGLLYEIDELKKMDKQINLVKKM